MKTKNVVKIGIPTVNVLAAYQGVARAYEIAKVGGHSISLCYYKSIDGDYERDVNPKDCAAIAEAFGFTPVVEGDLLIDVCRADFDYLVSGRKFETLEDIQVRIDQAKAFQVVTEFEKYDVCMSLLKTAYDRLNLGVYDVQTIFKVAATIARMAFSEVIRIEHIAEAIQYRSLQRVETTKIYKPSND